MIYKHTSKFLLARTDTCDWNLFHIFWLLIKSGGITKEIIKVVRTLIHLNLWIVLHNYKLQGRLSQYHQGIYLITESIKVHGFV